MTMQFAQAALNLFVAVCLGAAIGLERQWRQRLAGLRTNALVALGAAIFVTYSRVVSDEEGAARMAAQVVSGIGFLGAGVIFKEGLNVRGLNTAATLWCSAAVGLLAGEGFALYALLAAVLVIGRQHPPAADRALHKSSADRFHRGRAPLSHLPRLPRGPRF